MPQPNWLVCIPWHLVLYSKNNTLKNEIVKHLQHQEQNKGDQFLTSSCTEKCLSQQNVIFWIFMSYWQPIWIKWSDVRNVEFEFHEILLPISHDVHFGQIKLNSCLIFIFLNTAVGILCTICYLRMKNLSSHKSFIACEKFWPRSSVHTSSKS